MSLLSYREAAVNEVGSAAAASEDPSRSMGGERGTPQKAWQVSADFNPLMERVLRAQEMAEGRRYRSISCE